MSDLLEDKFDEWLKLNGLSCKNRQLFAHLDPYEYPKNVRVWNTYDGIGDDDIFVILRRGVIKRPDKTRPLSDIEIKDCLEYMRKDYANIPAVS